MKSTIFLILGLSLLVGLSQQKPVKDPVDDFLKQILELLKQMMAEGNPALGIPILDPFEVPHFDIPHIEEDIITADVSIENLVIRNLSTFDTKLAHLDLEQLSLALELGIKDLRGDAIYNLTGNILGLIPLYGDGDIWLEIYDLDLYAMASVLINEEGFVRVTEMEVSANFTSIKLHLDNLLGGGNFGESINNLLNLLGDYIWDQLKDILFPLLETVLRDVINDALDGCSIADLIESGSCFRENMRRLSELVPSVEPDVSMMVLN